MNILATILLAVYYLLPGSMSVSHTDVSHVYDYLPFESDGTGSNTEVSPERRAADWFASYTATSKTNPTRFLTEGDVLTGALESGDVTVLWINLDRVGYSLEQFDAEWNDQLCQHLASFVQRGGCLLLTKQATRLATKIGRAMFWPSTYSFGGYVDATDTWYMTYDFCTGANRNDHPVYRYTTNHEERDGVGHTTCFPLCSGSGTYRRTDNNSIWGDWGAYGITAEGCDPSRRHSLQLAMDCRVLGGWGHTRGMDCAGMLEFVPTSDFRGTVIAMGLAAYQWGVQNTSQYNVEALTRGCLEYLEEQSPMAVSTLSAPKTSTKVLRNGRLYIETSLGTFDALGTRQ